MNTSTRCWKRVAWPVIRSTNNWCWSNCSSTGSLYADGRQQVKRMLEPRKAATGARQGILSLTIKDKNALYAAYMSFVRNGGLFVPTSNSYKLGDEVFIQIGRATGRQERNTP